MVVFAEVWIRWFNDCFYYGYVINCNNDKVLLVLIYYFGLHSGDCAVGCYCCLRLCLLN